MKKKDIAPYYVINWDFNKDDIEYYDIMPYLVGCWEEELKRDNKIWNLDYTEEDDKIDKTLMPQTFDEFKKFVLRNSQYQFWSRCEYEVIVTGWPVQKREVKLDVFSQIKANIDVVTKHFMNNI